MIPAQILRTLRRAAELTGSVGALEEALRAGDAATHDDLLDLLDTIAERVDGDRPRPPGAPARRVSTRASEVLELASQGLRDPEIARRVGRSVEAVRMIRRRHGVAGQDPRPAKTGWEEPTREAHARGLTVAEIAAELGVSRGAVYQRLQRLGLSAN